MLDLQEKCKIWYFTLISMCLILVPMGFAAEPAGIKAIDLNSLSGNRIQLRLTMSGPIPAPKSFVIEKPAKIVLDFAGIKNLLNKKDSHPIFNQGVIKKANIVEDETRTRVVIDLNESVPYEVTQRDNYVFITLNQTSDIPSKTTAFSNKNTGSIGRFSLSNIDFRRGPNDEGKVIIDLSNPDLPIDLKEEGSRITLRFVSTHVPQKLERKMDVTDFGTPIQLVNVVQDGNDTLMHIDSTGITESMAYQADNRFTVEVRRLTQKEKEAIQKETFEYTGERLSLNFQDIEVRAVLQLIADFTGLNIVTSDTVRGNVTLRLRNVPWDQALAIILKTKGLDKRQIGNVLLIGPSEELAAREKLELQSNQQVEDLAPLRSEYIQVNYAKASDIAALLKDENNTLLSARGSASVDERTNTLLVQDTVAKIDEIRALVHRLDIPIRQVLIESRVVFANDDFDDALGVRFGGAIKLRPGNEPVLGLTGAVENAALIALGQDNSHVPGFVPPQYQVPIANRLGVNLPATISNAGGQSGTLGISVAHLPGNTILDLELQALEAEGLGKIVASPRLVTSNQQQAYIEAGEEIPYQEATSSGAAAVSFKKAVLRLEVIPQITPDDHVFLDLRVNQDSRGEQSFTGGPPAINTREIHTKVLVANGDTVVLGGIYQQTKNERVTRIPFLGRLPAVGWLFRSEVNSDRRNELMIFVTPKIIQEGMT